MESTEKAISVNSTTRTVNFDPRAPNIAFVSPTPVNASGVGVSYVVVNVTTNDTNNHSVLVDFNRSLVGWWRFNNESGENASQFKDWSSYSYNATCSGATCPNVTSSGRLGKGMLFDGTDDHINVTRMISDDFTIAVWINERTSLANNGACSSDYWYCGFGVVDAEVSNVVNDFGLSIKDNRAFFGTGNPDSNAKATTSMNSSK